MDKEHGSAAGTHTHTHPPTHTPQLCTHASPQAASSRWVMFTPHSFILRPPCWFAAARFGVHRRDAPAFDACVSADASLPPTPQRQAFALEAGTSNRIPGKSLAMQSFVARLWGKTTCHVTPASRAGEASVTYRPEWGILIAIFQSTK